MAGEYDAITPYHFALSNPISLNDPTGLWVSEKPAPVKPNSREPGSSSEPSAGLAGDSNSKKPTPVEPIDPLKQAVAAANIERPNERGRFGDGLVKHDVKCPICGKASCNHEPYEKALKASALMLAIPTKTPTWQGKVLTGIAAVAVVGVTWGYYRWYGGTKPEAIDIPIDIVIPAEPEPLVERRIALGIDDLLSDFAPKVNALPYGLDGWAKVSDSKETVITKLLAVGLLPNVTFHFNLSSDNGRIDSPVNQSVFGNKTTLAELKIITTFFMYKTTFYIKSGSIYKPIKK